MVRYSRGKELDHIPQGASWVNELLLILFTIKDDVLKLRVMEREE